MFGVRVQPNHPADDLGGILLAAVDGLLYGCGDAVIGVNPATDSVDTVAAILHGLDRLIDGARRADAGAAAWPTSPRNSPPWTAGRRSTCCSSRSPAPQAANASFGVTLALLTRGPRAGAGAPPRRGTWPGSATR